MKLVWIAAIWMAVVNPACAQDRDVKAGAYYFDGWTSQTGHLKPRLLREFADREPVWGWYDDSLTTMQQQIDVAADAGLRFFAFDWYYPEDPDKQTHLNTGLDLYLRSPNRDRLEFCLLVANHGGFRIGPNDWDAVCDLWMPLFQNPRHLKVRGKPLLIIFSNHDLLKSFETTQSVHAAFDRLQERARVAGLPGVEICACATPGPERGWSDLAKLRAAGFTSFTGYNYVSQGGAKRGDPVPYQSLVDLHLDVWRTFASKNVLPYIPVVTAGWDKRPWEDAATTATNSVYFPDRTPEKFGAFVREALRWLDANPAATPAERLLLIYAWNEYGEGGYIAPTRGDGNRYLEELRRVLKQGQ